MKHFSNRNQPPARPITVLERIRRHASNVGATSRDLHRSRDQRRQRLALRDQQADAIADEGSTIGIALTASEKPSVPASFAGGAGLEPDVRKALESLKGV